MIGSCAPVKLFLALTVLLSLGLFVVISMIDPGYPAWKKPINVFSLLAVGNWVFNWAGIK